MVKDWSQQQAEQSLTLRAAWLHYVGGLTQAAVAKKLGVPQVKAHRMIARAVADGAVRVTIDGDIVECIELSERLCDKFVLDFCDVAPDLGEDGLPLRTLARTAAARLQRWMQGGEVDTIGVGHGRTLAATARELPRFQAKGIRFVSLMGELTRSYAANPHTVMHLLAERTAAQAYVFPVPLYANSAEDRNVLLAQRGVREVYAMARAAPLKVLGIGTVHPDNHLVQAGMISPDEVAEISRAGGVGELLGHFFNAEGEILEIPLSDRTLSVNVDDTRSDRIAAVAGGDEKIEALRAVLRSGRLSGLVTDERSARHLLDEVKHG
ncbi:MAG: sugar-binding transcriptional regulator [Pseudomonadota bacterium]